MNRVSEAEVNSDAVRETSQYFDSWMKDFRTTFELPEIIDKPAVSQSLPAKPQNELRFEGRLSIDCRVIGSLRSLAGALIVSETGEVDGDLEAAVAVIDGHLVGDIHAIDRVEIGSTGTVIGNIYTASLSIQPGAVFEGQCIFIPNANGTAESNSNGHGPSNQ